MSKNTKLMHSRKLPEFSRVCEILFDMGFPATQIASLFDCAAPAVRRALHGSRKLHISIRPIRIGSRERSAWEVVRQLLEKLMQERMQGAIDLGKMTKENEKLQKRCALILQKKKAAPRTKKPPAPAIQTELPLPNDINLSLSPSPEPPAPEPPAPSRHLETLPPAYRDEEPPAPEGLELHGQDQDAKQLKEASAKKITNWFW